MTYAAPLNEQLFVLKTVGSLAQLAESPHFRDASTDVVESILGESSKLAAEIFAPLNGIGDRIGARWSGGSVILPDGFAEAYRLFVANGWGALSADPVNGGQGLPFVVPAAVQEQLTSANMAFSLCMLLTQGAIAAIEAHGSSGQKAAFLPRLVSGEWTGTMNLTEPQAGSDVGAVKAQAEPQGDGTFLIKGTKIFITWGEHDLAENIVHLVLARLPGAPAGTKGISLFLVPKFLPDASGNPGMRNDVRCLAIEHKLGIHASPTCTMSFGDEGRCIGWLIGAENAGMRAMFTMMNHARLNVGLQGVAIAERALQAAVTYARERVQSVPVEGNEGQAIIAHPDVRRMLMTMRAQTQAARAITYYAIAAMDHARVCEGDERFDWLELVDLLTPVAKAWSTDIGVEVSSLCIQVFGGMGYVEEAGVAQHFRDARIAPIYEGTNGIQAMDLALRKLGHSKTWMRLFDRITADLVLMRGSDACAPMVEGLSDALACLRAATRQMVDATPRQSAGAATPYLRLFALTLGGWLLVRQSMSADGDAGFLRSKIATARFFIDQILPQVNGLSKAVNADVSQLFAIGDDELAVQ